MIIGLVGKKQSGKDTLARIIKELFPEHGFKRVGFADPVKRIACLLTGLWMSDFETEEQKSTPLPHVWKLATRRQLLQVIGTEFGRKTCYEDIWVDALMNGYKESINNDPLIRDRSIYDVSEEDEVRAVPQYPNWIICDVRFPNEAEAIRKKGGLLIKLHRPDYDLVDTHESEAYIDKIETDYLFVNPMTGIETFINLTKLALNHIVNRLVTENNLQK